MGKNTNKKWVKNASDEKAIANGCWFDESEGERIVSLIENHFRHSQGEKAGSFFVLEDWQKEEIVYPIFSWKGKDNFRRFRTVWLEIPRKNGKSIICSCLGLVLLIADNEAGAEVIVAAPSRNQARKVFSVAKNMVLQSEQLSNIIEPFAHSLYHSESNSSLFPVSSEGKLQYGYNPSGVIIDEVTCLPDRTLYDALRTGRGSRRQPLMIGISQAGYDRESLAFEWHEKTKQIRNGEMEDDSFYGVVYCAEETDDWQSEETWRKANPNYGISVKARTLKEEAQEAANSPAYLNTFKRDFLNIWTDTATAFFNMDRFSKCNEGVLIPEDLHGRTCVAGLDLGSTSDMTACALVFPPIEEGEPYKVLLWYWIAGDNVPKRVLKDRVPYDVWIGDDYLRTTLGDVTDYHEVFTDLRTIFSDYDIVEAAIDKQQATYITSEIDGLGYTTVDFKQWSKFTSPPLKELQRLVADKRIEFGGNPIIAWNAANTQVKADKNGDYSFVRTNRSKKYDGISATIFALHRMLLHEDHSKIAKWTSVYETQGVSFV